MDRREHSSHGELLAFSRGDEGMETVSGCGMANGDAVNEGNRWAGDKSTL
jgi:hypothetical protein